ncbi:MAG: 3,4-dihydroxy-2-butanone-4-phosphate synthase [Pseudomonadota bacterium]|nr:3,4-dihydroxy-2-butanone-4-phosphate synthase [Pseudomonadota bacterium]
MTPNISSTFKRLATATKQLQAGKMVVLYDDQERENEGDLVFAGSMVDAAKITFMAREACGLICLSLPPDKVASLGLQMINPEAIARNPRGTPFTVSIDAREGISTGISAADRARTIALACSEQASANDFVAPGHLFPLCADAGGVLARAGHTEGASDLLRLAALPAGAVICEIMNPDGTMARRRELREFATKHALPMLGVDDIMLARLLHEPLVQKREFARVASEFSKYLGTDICCFSYGHSIAGTAAITMLIYASGFPFADDAEVKLSLQNLPSLAEQADLTTVSAALAVKPALHIAYTIAPAAPIKDEYIYALLAQITKSLGAKRPSSELPALLEEMLRYDDIACCELL